MLNKDGEEEIFYAKRIIDATQDGDVCVDAGVPYTIGMEDVNWKQNMAATLVIKIGGVEWKDIEADINKDFDFVADLGYEVTREKCYKTNKHVFIRRSQEE